MKNLKFLFIAFAVFLGIAGAFAKSHKTSTYYVLSSGGANYVIYSGSGEPSACTSQTGSFCSYLYVKGTVPSSFPKGDLSTYTAPDDISAQGPVNEVYDGD